MQITDIFRHPVKSIGAEALAETRLEPGRAMAGDRVYALAHAAGAYDPAAPAWVSCENFLRIANHPRLAALPISYCAESARLQASDGRVGPIDADLSTEAGRAALSDWLEKLLGDAAAAPLRVAQVPGQALTDSPLAAVSLHSKASLRALSERCGLALDPRRFRANFWLEAAEGAPLAPWEEFDWIGREITLGRARLRVLEPISRCAATAADPESGVRDVWPNRVLRQAYDHGEFGVLAEVLEGGLVKIGDRAALGAGS